MTLAFNGKSRRRISLLGLIGSVAVIGAILFSMSGGGSGSAVAQDSNHKVTICHRTNSNTNPYVVITVDKNAAGQGQDAGDHADRHQGPVWNPMLKDQHIMWGDIIPPFTFDGESFPGLNWTEEGQAIYENGCVPVVATATATPTETATEAPESPTATETATETATATATATETATATATETATETVTATETATATTTATATETATETVTATETATATATGTATETVTPETATATATTPATETPVTQTQQAVSVETPTEAVAGVRPQVTTTPIAPTTGTGTQAGDDAARLAMVVAGLVAVTAGAAMFAIRRNR